MDLVVRQGSHADRGMVAFKDEVTPEDLENIRAYLVHRANQDKRDDASGRSPRPALS